MHKRINAVLIAVAIAIIVLIARSSAHAASGSWTSTNSGNWSNTANWSGGTIADGAGFTGTFNANINNPITVTIDTTSRTLGILNIGDTNSNNSYTIASSGGATLTFDNTPNSANAQLNQTSGSNGDTISAAPILLNSSLNITNASPATLTISGGITAGTAGTKTITTSTGLVTISGVIGNGSGTVAVTQNGPGTLSLTGANTYSGGTTISAGTLQLSGSGTLGSTSGTLTVNGGTLNLGGTSQGVGNFTGSGGTILNNATGTNVTLTIGNGNGTGGNYSGVIADHTSGTGTVALTKTGTGTITLSGTNTYTGGTTVNAGTLLVSNTTGSGTGTGAVRVNGSGTTLGGTGTITGTVTLGNTTPGAILNPGPKGTAGTAASVGTLRTGALTLTGSNTFHIDASGTLTSNWDQLIVTGGVTLGTTSVLDLTIASGLSFTGGTQYVLISNDLTDAISGTFANAANGSTVVFDGYLFTVNYAGGDGNDFTLTAVPEPGTWIGASLALAALALSQRRRFAKSRKAEVPASADSRRIALRLLTAELWPLISAKRSAAPMEQGR